MTVQNHIYTLLPFFSMFLGDKTSLINQIIPLLLILPLIWGKIKDVYYWIIKPKNTITIIQKTDKKRGLDQVNFTFEAVCYYFDTHDKVSNLNTNYDLFCDKAKLGYNYVYQDDEGGNYCSYEPIFTPEGDRKLEYNKFILKFFFYEDEGGKNIIISGAPKDVLKEFVNDAIKEYETHLYIKNDDKKYIYSYCKDAEIWEGKEIRVKKNMDNVFLPTSIKTKLTHDLDEFVKNKTFYEKIGIPYKRGYLFKGSPGTGKSSTVYAISAYLEWNIYKVSPKWFSRKEVRKSISIIPPKSIVLIEEIDTHVGDNRAKKPKKKKEKKVDIDSEGDAEDCDDDSDEVCSVEKKKVDLSEMLDIIDGYEYLHECIVIFTTNYPEQLDAALIRAGRMDIHFDFGHLEYKEVVDAITLFVEDCESIQVPTDIKIESAKLLNEILIPNRNNPKYIEEILNKK